MAYPLFGSYINITILIIFLVSMLSVKNFKISANPFSKTLLLYIASITISVFFSINLRSSLYEIYKLIPLLCVFFLVANHKENDAKIINLIIIPALILSIYGIYQYLLGFEHTKEFLSLHFADMLETRYAREILLTKRAIASFFSPNMLGAYLAMSIPLYAGLIFKGISQEKIRFWQIIPLALLFIALVFTKSLSAWISLAIGIIIFFTFIKHFPKKIILIISLFILLMPVILIFTRCNMFINIANQQNTILQRLGFWRSTLHIIKDFPFTGIGIGNLKNIYPLYKELIANETMFSHNLLLQVWAETGILGIISIILLIITFVRISLKTERNFINAGIISSCCVFIVNNLFDFSFFVPQVSFVWWVVLGLLSKNKVSYKTTDRRIKYFIILIITSLIYLNTISAIGMTHFKNGNYEKSVSIEPYNDIYHAAMGDYNKAIELNPYSPFYHKKLGQLYLEKGMEKEAISEFEKASLLYPSNPHFHKRLFDLYKAAGEDEKAEKEEAKLKEFHSRYSGYFIR